MASMASISYPPSPVSMDHQLAACGGCQNPVDDGDGVVVAFGNSLWHVDCFKCAKCGNRVSPDTNLLLLSDGSPVCAACSYNCAVCKKPISHEAIMTGDESYHAACFTCKTCGRHIGELVFAKTTQGIYCMSCHNERVARSRRHAEQRKQKHKLRDPTRDKENKLREKPSNLNLREGDATIPETPPTTPGLHNPQITSADSAVSHAAKRISTQSLSATLHNTRQQGDLLHTSVLPSIQSSPTQQPSSSLSSPTATTTYVPSQESVQSTRGDPSPLLNTRDLPTARRKSFDDGVRPKNNLLSPEPAISHSHQLTAANGTSRADKRSSINPGVRLDWLTANPPPPSKVLMSPSNASPTTGNTLDHLAVESPSTLHDSSERSWSPRPRQASPTSTSTDVFYSPPLSPSIITLSQQRSQAENIPSQDREPPSTRKHSLPDTSAQHQSQTNLSSDRETTPMDPHSLPDTALPYLHPHPPDQNPLPDYGPKSPARPHTSQGDTGVFSRQQETLPLDQSIAGKSSSLGADIGADRGAEAWTDDVDLEVSKIPDAPETEEIVSIPLGLPRMSFLEGDTNFHDLLKFGAGQSNVPVTLPENVDESNTGLPNLETPIPKMPIADTQQREEDKEASPSKSSTAPLGITIPSLEASPMTKSQNLPSPLTTLPRRNESLSRKMSARKPVPKAIVLPDTFEEDMALELDESSTGAPSPGFTPGRSDAPVKAVDSVVKPPPRRGSAEVESRHPPPLSPRSKARRASANISPPLSSDPTTSTPVRSISSPSITVMDSASSRTVRPLGGKQDASELVAKRIQEALTDAHKGGATSVRLDREFLEVIYLAVQASREKLHDMRGKFDGMRRASQQYIDGLSVAQEEYDNELVARREAEAEVTRLKVQLSGQAARLTELSAGERKRDVVEQMSRDMSASLHGLERDLSKLKTERDLTVAEVEELAAAKKNSSSGQTEVTLHRSLTSRFDNLKTQYKRELEPLVQQREALVREINELKEERNICLEETTALNARNEELAELNARTARQIESGMRRAGPRAWSPMPLSMGLQQSGTSTPKSTPLPPVPPGSGYTSSTLSVGTSHDEREEPRATPTDRRKWFKPSKEAIRVLGDGPPVPEKETLRHNFQQLTILRFARCYHCGDKMWGTQLRCTTCNIGCHNRCAGQLTLPCVNEPRPNNEIVSIPPLQPSMFGRDLIEQVRADSAKEHRDIPIIVEKCISAVELNAIDYEGIYRKTGGSSQSKAITQLFERGDYDAFDLGDSELFNDISSVTSVLKTYFRQLPNPLLTHALHEAFVGAAIVREPRGKAEALSSLVYQLPSEHFHTLRYLMLHLHRIQLRRTENLMNASNLGMVFGPTLMRSSDLNREYADMAGKALAIEWLIENAPSVFREDI